MLKTAYQLGIQRALDEINVNQLVKEAQELGIDVEKIAFLGTLANVGKAALSGAKTIGSAGLRAGKGLTTGIQRGLQQGEGALGALGRGASGAGKQLSSAWGSLSPTQRRALMGAGATGLYAM